jgi:hypothetical protein
VFEDGEVNVSGQIDDIEDFQPGDKIDLSLIDANVVIGAAGDQAFRFIGTDDFVTFLSPLATAEVRYFVRTDGHLQVDYSTDIDSADEGSIIVRGVTSLSASDFIL